MYRETIKIGTSTGIDCRSHLCRPRKQHEFPLSMNPLATYEIFVLINCKYPGSQCRLPVKHIEFSLHRKTGWGNFIVTDNFQS